MQFNRDWKIFSKNRKPQYKASEFIVELAKKHGPTTNSFPVPYLKNRMSSPNQRACMDIYLKQDPWYEREFEFDGDLVKSTIYKYTWNGDDILAEVDDWYATRHIPEIPLSRSGKHKADAAITATADIPNFKDKISLLKQAGLCSDIFLLNNIGRTNGVLTNEYHKKSGQYWNVIQQLSREARVIVFDNYRPGQ